MRFSDLNCIKRCVSDQFHVLNAECYTTGYERLVEIAAERYRDILKKDYDYVWGDDVPENDVDLFELISKEAI